MSRAPAPAQLARLARLTALARDAALGELRRAGAARRAIEAEIAALDARLAHAPDSADDLATLSGATARWRAAQAGARAQMMARLAQARATEEEQRSAAARAHGRDLALTRLMDRLK